MMSLGEPLLSESTTTPTATTRRGHLALGAAVLLEVGGTLCMRLVATTEWWRIPAYVLYGAAFSSFLG